VALSTQAGSLLLLLLLLLLRLCGWLCAAWTAGRRSGGAHPMRLSPLKSAAAAMAAQAPALTIEEDSE